VNAEYIEVPSTDPTEHGDGGRDQAAGRLARCRDGSHADGGDDLVEKKTDALGPGRRGYHHTARRTSRPFASMSRWAWRVNLAQVRKLSWAQQSSMRAIRRSGTAL
jgi:hypothetical protein